MFRNTKVSLVCTALVMVIAACGQNAADEPTQNITPAENITGTTAATQAGQYTDYGTSALSGYSNNIGQSYGPCPNNPTQVCVQQVARACSGFRGMVFGQNVSQCNANLGVQSQIRIVQVHRIITPVVVVVPTQNCPAGNCPQTPQTNCPAGTCVQGPNDGQQIQYGDRSCQHENVVLGSVKFNVGTYTGTNNQFVTLSWNDFKGNQPAIQYYRIVIYGDEAMLPENSWVSQKVFANPFSKKVATIIDANSIGGFEPVAFGGLIDIASEQSRLGERVSWQRNATYWYKIIAFTGDGQVALGSDQQELHRPFDIRLVDCTPTVIAGFCTFN